MSWRTDDIELRNDANIFSEEMASRNQTSRYARRCVALLAVFLVVLLTCMCMPTNIGGNPLYEESPATVFWQFYLHLGDLLTFAAGGKVGHEAWILKFTIGAVAGGALGVCGSVYQGALRNPLAAPKTLGVMSGGALGALVYVIWVEPYIPSIPWSGTITTGEIVQWVSTLNPWELLLVSYGRVFCSMIGCFAIVGLVLLVSTFVGRGKLSNITMIIAGQIFATGITALIMYFKYLYIANGATEVAEKLAAIENYTMVSGFSKIDLAIICIPLLLLMGVLFALRGRLTILSLGDEEAQAMGVNVRRMRISMVVICTVMTAISISFCGHIAFLGFISAHLARKVVGPDMRYLIPASICTGGTMFVLVYWLTISGLPFTAPGSAGVICGVIGAVVFLILALGQRGGAMSGWGGGSHG